MTQVPATSVQGQAVAVAHPGDQLDEGLLALADDTDVGVAVLQHPAVGRSGVGAAGDDDRLGDLLPGQGGKGAETGLVERQTAEPDQVGAEIPDGLDQRFLGDVADGGMEDTELNLRENPVDRGGQVHQPDGMVGPTGVQLGMVAGGLVELHVDEKDALDHKGPCPTGPQCALS